MAKAFPISSFSIMRMKPIADIARSAGIAENYLEPYGSYKAKISLDILKTKKENKKAKYVLVTAMTPTPKGEGKTVTAIGLSMAFNRIGKKSIVCLRQPSMGPLFGAKDVSYSSQARRKITLFTALGYGALPVCMAKTQFSLSHDPQLKGRPRGFALPVRDVRIAAGAGFVSVLCGAIQTMPGLPAHPAGTKVDIDREGNVVGIS